MKQFFILKLKYALLNLEIMIFWGSAIATLINKDKPAVTYQVNYSAVYLLLITALLKYQYLTLLHSGQIRFDRRRQFYLDHYLL